MNDLLQTAQHPDAEQLAAFAEECLPQHEHRRTMAHLAACPGCRQVVFLAQQALAAETPAPARQTARAGWFSGWNLVWPAAAAVAAIVAVSVHLRSAGRVPAALRPERAERADGMLPGMLPVPKSAPWPPAAASLPLQELPKAASHGLAPKSAVAGLASAFAQPKPPMRGRGSDNAAASAGVADKLVFEVRPAATVGQTPSAVFPFSSRAAKVSAGALPEPAAAAKAPGRTASAAAMAQSDAPAPVAIHRGAVPVSGPVALATTHPAMPAPDSAPPPGQVNQTVTVEAAAPMPSDAAAQIAAGAAVSQAASRQVPTAAPQLDESSARRAVINNRMVTNASVAVMPNPPLPSHLPALSSAVTTGRMLTLDTAGGLFLSKDRGQHWKAVKTQWSGQAMRVENAAAANPFGNVTGKPPAFVLTNDKGAFWTSADGVKWTSDQRKSQPR